MSAGLNTVAGTLYEDFEQYVLRGKRQSEAQQSFAMKVIVLVLGVVFILLVLVVEKLGTLFQVGFLSCWPTFYVPDVCQICSLKYLLRIFSNIKLLLSLECKTSTKRTVTWRPIYLFITAFVKPYIIVIHYYTKFEIYHYTYTTYRKI